MKDLKKEKFNLNFLQYIHGRVFRNFLNFRIFEGFWGEDIYHQELTPPPPKSLRNFENVEIYEKLYHVHERFISRKILPCIWGCEKWKK